MPAWVRFLRDHDEHLTRRSLRAHKADSVALLRDGAAQIAVDQGDAELIARPNDARVTKGGRVVAIPQTSEQESE